MNDLKGIAGRVLTPQGFVDGRIEWQADGRVARVEGTPVDLAAARDTAAPLILPGFIDLHVHGGGGHDIMEGGEAAAPRSATRWAATKTACSRCSAAPAASRTCSTR